MCNFPSCLLKTAIRIFGPMRSQWKGASYTSLTVAYVPEQTSQVLQSTYRKLDFDEPPTYQYSFNYY